MFEVKRTLDETDVAFYSREGKVAAHGKKG
jgi:hypothetical protein